MEQMVCHKLCYVEELAPVLDALKDLVASKVLFLTIPSFKDMFESQPKHYFFTATIDSAENNPIVIFHSSGSTGTSFHEREYSLAQLPKVVRNLFK